jgi:hypothetical protein
MDYIKIHNSNVTFNEGIDDFSLASLIDFRFLMCYSIQQ